MEMVPTSRIRNFGIIAHIDHGKSTLADRLLELTGCKSPSVRGASAGDKDCITDTGGIGAGIATTFATPPTLDTLPVERERGITVKAQAATMFYRPPPHQGDHAYYMLNLIDTPGHVDFTNEVSRSLTAIQGVLLVVDAVAGVQAQTMAHYWRVREHGLKAIIPIINKIDLPQADPHKTTMLLEKQLGLRMPPLLVSAKTGAGVPAILSAIIDHIPPPTVIAGAAAHAIVIDCWFKDFRGVICLVHVRAGHLRKDDQLRSHGSGAAAGRRWCVEEVGILQPEMIITPQLQAGQVGWLRCGMKQTTDVLIGDTLYEATNEYDKITREGPPLGTANSLPARLKPTVFAGCFPMTREQHEVTAQAIQKLSLNDSSVSNERIISTALGPGWRLGFLGSLHMDVFRQRLEQEFGVEVILTAPTVSYEVAYKDEPPTMWHLISCAEEYPEERRVASVRAFREPYVRANIIVPDSMIGPMLSLCSGARCIESNIQSLLEGEDRVKISVILPLVEIIGDFNDRLLSMSAGYASFDYEVIEGRLVELVKVAIRLNGDLVDVLSTVQPKLRAEGVARQLVGKLVKLLPRQQFTVAIQAVIGGKVIARETLPALRKDVIAKCVRREREERDLCHLHLNLTNLLLFIP